MTQNTSNAREIKPTMMQVAVAMSELTSRLIIAEEILKEIHDSLDTDPNDGNRAVLPAELAKRIEDFLGK